MREHDNDDLSFDDYDELRDPRPDNNEFDAVVDAAISRRGFLGGVLAFGSGAAAMGTTFLASEAQAVTANRFGFTPIPTSTANTITLPEGYEWETVVRWGQPLWSGVEDVDQATGGTAETQAMSFGDNTDGMAVFAKGDKQILAVNNEYIQNKVLLKNREDGKATNADDIQKMKNAHGISILEIEEGANGWAPVLDSEYNRRITIDTPMELTGPLAGHDMVKTDADPEGKTVLGTWNNCGNGETPWGTYLTCEENFNGYFGSADENQELPAEFKRYGIKTKSRYGFEKFDTRFDLSKNINEPNRHGFIVEIDATDPTSTPKKRSALGRFKHENAEVVLASDGRVVVYMGDDERGEFLYKFVSEDMYVEGGDTDGLLSEGQLYVAKFNDDLTGEWLALTPEVTGMSKEEICLHTRVAGSKVGATTMDRPEWVAVNPLRVEAYCALTNNKNRGIKTNAGGDETPVGGPNPREANKYGQIVRWRPTGGEHTDDAFTWDLYVMAGNPKVHPTGPLAGSDNVNEGNMFNSPDGMVFDSKGLLWIQTDGNFKNEGDFEGQGNNQMLIGDPATGEIVRFMTGPNNCEVTGLCFSLDRRTAFVGIQHPAADFPDGPGTLPRSCVVAVKRTDGGLVG
ncbi:MAG: PhoX family phosphatase [Cognatishimia sp.]|uniref:PhoX family protein n=1 Tax=Cognatishimia sp. TaxID=2211648 RepID=UPI003B8E5613